VVGEGSMFNFTPSNPWLAVGWRKPDDIRLDVTKPIESRDMRFVPTAASKVVPEANRIDLVDGTSLDYDYLVIATGPRLAFERVPMTFVTSEPYIGHMGLGGIGDSKGLLESELRQRHIKWVSNARVTSVEAGKVNAEQLNEQGEVIQTHEIPFAYSMFIPSFAGVDTVQGIEGLINPGGFILIDEHQRNPTYTNIFSAGVCVAIPPVEVTPVPTGAPKTGLMIESMVTAIAHNLRDELAGKPVKARATWNAMCLADMGDNGFAFIALPQIPPRNVTKSMTGKWLQLAKVAYEKYFMRKMRKGKADPLSFAPVAAADAVCWAELAAVPVYRLLPAGDDAAQVRQTAHRAGFCYFVL